MRFATPVLLVALLAASPAHAADPAVEKRLDARGIKYEVDDDGDYRVLYNYQKEKRTQLVFVGGSTEKTDAYVLREVFSPAAPVEGLDREKLVKLLTNSRHNKLGSWELEGPTLVYVIKLPDDATAAQLEEAMDMAGTVADDMEIELTGGKDEY